MQFTLASAAALVLAGSNLVAALPHAARDYYEAVEWDVVTKVVTVYAGTLPTPSPTPYVAKQDTYATTITYVYEAASSTKKAASSAVAYATPTPSTYASQSYTTKPVTGLSSDAQGALDAHNAARAELGYSALTWDADLTNSAQTWADHLASIDDLEHSQAGENLYMSWSSGGISTPLTDASNGWISEKASYHTPGFSEECGHYTQVVWEGTSKVGIAVGYTSSGAAYVVAHYDPAGNVGGQQYPPAN